MSRNKQLYALRGAVQCLNEAVDIEKWVSALYRELLAKNSLNEADVVSVIFSVTQDLDLLNPCAALRRAGWARELALFATQEPSAQDGLPRVIRILMHCYLNEGATLRHVYCNGAEVLRPDRKG
ncbi:MAG: chorismate mutase [Treponema sp.]|jgi:chorismate mutase|nr:chorismate mutase [Treponema sp.]